MQPRRVISLLFILFILVVSGAPSQTQNRKPQYPKFPSETPDKFVPVDDSFDYTRREVMIPMRDGRARSCA